MIAIEFDERMFQHLGKQYPGDKSLSLIHGDYLKFNEENLDSKNYIIIANLPYNISAPVFQKLADISFKPVAASILVQKEVAERLSSPAGQKGCSPLSIKLNNIYETEAGLIVPKTAFAPPPKVTSQLLTLKLRQNPLIPEDEMMVIMKLINAGFKFRRKKLINNLSFMADSQTLKSAFEEAGIDASSRAENVNLEQWQSLVSILVG